MTVGKGYVCGMLWRFLQVTVATAVLFANVYWGWTDNGYLAAVWAALAAIAVSWTIGKLIDLRRYGWSVVLSGKQGNDSGARSVRTQAATRRH